MTVFITDRFITDHFLYAIDDGGNVSLLADSEEEKEKRKEDDRLILRYDTVVRESALLTTTGGILFGFLLNLSINAREDLSSINKITLLVALYSITIAISLFVMPVIYHHLQYPYRDFAKFKNRSHRFMMFGLIPAGVTLYLALEIALSFTLGRG